MNREKERRRQGMGTTIEIQVIDIVIRVEGCIL
jgi:hypothetical protein